MYGDYSALKIERRGKVLVITIDNPPTNAISREIGSQLSRILTDVNYDRDCGAIVLTGAGEKAFSAGGDIKRMAERVETGAHAEWIAGNADGRRLVNAFLHLEKPLINRINGHAMGLGSTIAVFGDITVMMAQARIADTHVKVGLSAGDGGSLIWPLLMGFTKARKHLLTGAPLTGKEAAETGLVTESADTVEELDHKTFGLAEELADGAQLAISSTKMSINLVLRRILDGVIDTHLGLETYTYLTADHLEAVTAFRDKRTPEFCGE